MAHHSESGPNHGGPPQRTDGVPPSRIARYCLPPKHLRLWRRHACRDTIKQADGMGGGPGRYCRMLCEGRFFRAKGTFFRRVSWPGSEKVIDPAKRQTILILRASPAARPVSISLWRCRILFVLRLDNFFEARMTTLSWRCAVLGLAGLLATLQSRQSLGQNSSLPPETAETRLGSGSAAPCPLRHRRKVR